MKILCVIDNLNTGGAQRQIINLARGLHRRGHEVSMFCYSPGALLASYLEREGVPVHVQLKGSRFSLGIFRGLRDHIDEGGFQAVVSFLNTPNFYALLSSRMSRTHPAVIVSERFCDLPGNPNRIELAVRQFYRLSSAIVVNSHHQRLNFLRRYRWMEGRISTIYNGYDLAEFAPPDSEPDNPQLEILVVSGIAPYKNGLCLVKALDILGKEDGLRPRVSWAGRRTRTGAAGDYLSKMEAEIENYGLPGQWRWLDQRTDIAALLRQHDVLVHPSYGEGLPNAVCEALACGRPVIVSQALDHSYLVKEAVNGFLFDWDDPGDLAAKLKRFHDLPKAERHAMGEKGRDYAEKNLSLDRFVGEFEAVIVKGTQ